MNLRKLFAIIGVFGELTMAVFNAKGLATAVVGVSHLWPLVTPTPGYNTMLHALTSWLLLPLGLTIAIRDSYYAGFISSPSQFFGSHFDPVFDFISSEHRYIVVLIWAGLTSASFDGIYGVLGFLLLLTRAGTLIDLVVKIAQQVIDKLEERGVKIPGMTAQAPE